MLFICEGYYFVVSGSEDGFFYVFVFVVEMLELEEVVGEGGLVF